MRQIITLICLYIFYADALKTNKILRKNSTIETVKPKLPIRCSCGIFMSSQLKKGSKEQPKGNPVLVYETRATYPCNNFGNKICVNKCLDIIIKYIPNSAKILCGTLNRDCFKEQAYLFIKNYKDEWINTNLSAGRDYCCKDGVPFKCPISLKFHLR